MKKLYEQTICHKDGENAISNKQWSKYSMKSQDENNIICEIQKCGYIEINEACVNNNGEIFFSSHQTDTKYILNLIHGTMIINFEWHF